MESAHTNNSRNQKTKKGCIRSQKEWMNESIYRSIRRFHSHTQYFHGRTFPSQMLWALPETSHRKLLAPTAAGCTIPLLSRDYQQTGTVTLSRVFAVYLHPPVPPEIWYWATTSRTLFTFLASSSKIFYSSPRASTDFFLLIASSDVSC